MLTSLVLGRVAYSNSGIAFAGFSGTTESWATANLSDLKLNLDIESCSSMEFTVEGCGSAPPFPAGLVAKLYIANDDGSTPVIKFSGDLNRPKLQPSSMGPVWGYTASDLKKRSDGVTLVSSSGAGVASYNLEPTDPLYLFTLAGLTVGGIVKDILQGSTNAAALYGVGVGNYTVAGSVYTLPMTTTEDLGALTIVPPSPVRLQGEGILGRLQSFIQQWQSQFTLYVEPDGTIRVVSIFGAPLHTLTQPSGATRGDPVDNLDYSIDLNDCYAAVQIVGQDIRGALLSFRDGTLTRATTPAQLAAWTSASFTSPTNTANNNNASDQGKIIAATSVGCTVKSDFGAVKWDANYWNSNGGVIVLISTLDDGMASVNTTVTVQVTSCSQMVPGGIATITWDSSAALAVPSAYTKYKLFATNTPISKVDRAFYVTNPATGAFGLNTYIGSHLYPMFPFPFAWANQGKGAASVQLINYPEALVLWSSNGQYPFFAASLPVDLDPTTGEVILTKPAVFISAGFANQTAALASGYPSSYYQGKWWDVQVAVPYNAGDIAVRAPSSGFSGTAFTAYGVTTVKTIALNSFTWAADAPALATLANEVLLTVQDAVVEGSIRLHYDTWSGGFDPLKFPYALSIVTPSGGSAIAGLKLPVRKVRMEWPDSGPDINLVVFEFSNRHRQFEGDSLYVHPSFAPSGWGSADGQAFLAGAGMVGLSDYNASARPRTRPAGDGMIDPTLGMTDPTLRGDTSKGWADAERGSAGWQGGNEAIAGADTPFHAGMAGDLAADRGGDGNRARPKPPDASKQRAEREKEVAKGRHDNRTMPREGDVSERRSERESANAKARRDNTFIGPPAAERREPPATEDVMGNDPSRGDGGFVVPDTPPPPARHRRPGGLAESRGAPEDTGDGGE